jgi:hypothetical protein
VETHPSNLNTLFHHGVCNSVYWTPQVEGVDDIHEQRDEHEEQEIKRARDDSVDFVPSKRKHDPVDPIRYLGHPADRRSLSFNVYTVRHALEPLRHIVFLRLGKDLEGFVGGFVVE